MSADERILRLENAMATLAELSAQHNERMAQNDERKAQHDERISAIARQNELLLTLVAKHDERMAQNDQRTSTLAQQNELLLKLTAQHDGRIASLEKSFQALTQLAVSASERADQHGAWINQLGAAQAEADAKIAALADAQIRTEKALARLTLKVDNLTDLVRGGRNGQTES